MPIREAALNFLLFETEGPVGQEVKRRAERVADLARANVEIIMHRNPAVADDIPEPLMDGNTAIVGLEDRGEISRYLAEKAKRSRLGDVEVWPNGWLNAAAEEAFGEE